jgi:hypothetical protein
MPFAELVGSTAGTALRKLRHRKVARLAVLAAARFVLTPNDAQAVTSRTWIGATGGNWSTAGNWSPSGSPATGDTLSVLATNSNLITSMNEQSTGLFPNTTPAPTFATVSVDGNGSFSSTVNTPSVVGTSLNISSALYVGLSAGATYNNTATINLSSSSLYVGYYAGSNGTINNSGLVTGLGDETIGAAGTGTFNDSGTHSVGGALLLGNGSSSTSHGNYVLSGNGVLTVGNGMTIGYFYVGGGSGSFNQTGGSNTVTNSINVYNGSYSLSNGTLSGISSSLYTSPTGTFTQSGGICNIPVNSNGSFVYTGGSFNAGLSLYGTSSFTGTFDANGTLGIFSNVNVPATTTVDGTHIDIEGSVTLSGGTLGGAGDVSDVNNGLITGYGTVACGPILNNYSVIQPTGGNLTFTASLDNFGNIDLEPGRTIYLSTVSTSYNDVGGSINLNGGTLAGNKYIANFGTIAGHGLVSTLCENTQSGMIVAQGGTLNFSMPLSNDGTIQVTAGATLSGGEIVSDGLIQGAGLINSSITNTGTVSPVDGGLTISGALTNSVGGNVTAAGGNALYLNGGLATNSGAISLNGGTIKISGTVNNAHGANITGYGILGTDGLTNDGTILFAGGSTTLNGDLTNNSDGSITIENTPALITGNVTNNGTITVLNTTATFTGTYTGKNYISDPSTNIFQNNVSVVTGGSMTGGVGDKYLLSGGVFNNQGIFTNAGALQSSDNASNSGTFKQSGPQTWSAGTTFTNTAGSSTFASDTGSASSAPLSINVTGGLVTFSSTQHLAALSVSNGATVTESIAAPHTVLVTGSFSNLGLINLTNNDMVVQTTTASSLFGQLKTGFNAHLGYWNGASGIVSTAAANDTRHLTTLGYRQSDGTAFDGVATSTADALVKYTYYGDATLDGIVNGADYQQIDNGFGAHLTGWSNGDFNYDGVVDGSDFSLIDNTFNQIKAVGASSLALIASPTDVLATATISAVPEPVSTSLLTIAALAPFLRRHRLRNAAHSCSASLV